MSTETLASPPQNSAEQSRLAEKRAIEPAAWTFDDHTNLMRLQRAEQLRQEAELTHDLLTEARTRQARRVNFHE